MGKPTTMAHEHPTGEATIGPFFPERYVDAGANDLTSLRGRSARGEPIEIHGCVTQEDGKPLHNVIDRALQVHGALGVVVLLVLLGRQLDGLEARRVAASLAKIAVASLIMAAAARAHRAKAPPLATCC